MEAVRRTIKFNEELHRYTDEDNNVYTSVTTLIGKYHPQFNENEWALKKSLDTSPYNPYRGMSVSQIKSQWKDTREYSQNRGNVEHKLLEDSINESNGKASFEFDKEKIRIGEGHGLITITKVNLHILANSKLASKYPKIYAYLRKHIEEGWTLFAEKRIYWFDYLIAGTIDCLLVKGKFFIIVDWKTNKDVLKFKSGYYKKYQGVKTTEWIDKKEYFFQPLQHIEHCKGMIYTMQLSLYAYLLELWGFKCINLCLFHILNEIPQEPYKIDYREKDCKILLEWNLKGFQSSKSISSNQNKVINFGIH